MLMTKIGAVFLAAAMAAVGFGVAYLIALKSPGVLNLKLLVLIAASMTVMLRLQTILSGVITTGFVAGILIFNAIRT